MPTLQRKRTISLVIIMLIMAIGIFNFIQWSKNPHSLIPVDGSQQPIAENIAFTLPQDNLSMEPLPTITKVIVYKGKHYMELYSGDKMVRRYPIRLGFSPTGHKKEEGDGKTPEGDYVIDWRNPNSLFYRSFHISYPNEADKKQARARGVSPGGDIMIHGSSNKTGLEGEKLKTYMPENDWTWGCIAVSNAMMDEMWDAIPNGTPITIHP